MFFIATDANVNYTQYKISSNSECVSIISEHYKKNIVDYTIQDVFFVRNNIEDISFNIDSQEMNDSINFLAETSFAKGWENEDDEYWENY